ncbi:hypothetical protein F5Y18DRAFT_422363 [Xylariaceae sp. FL1019]|nr:hypothetical protein F5Y18DRAFT_422363 [Xylariaceae sp. FL1019]
MPSSAIKNPSAKAESSKKKKTKAPRTESPAPSASPAPEKAASVSGAEGADDESPYIQELKKNIRNINKKILNASKTDPVIEQNPGKTLDELVAAKLINADQRAQRLKKPQLEAQLAQIEEQLVQFKKVDDEYRARSAEEKAFLESTLSESHAKDKADAISALTEQAANNAKQSLKDSLLVLSQFLRLAATRRSEDADAGLDENMALEGVLLNVYSGDENAVSTMMKLIEGSDEATRSVNGDALQTTFGQVKAAAVDYVSSFTATEPAPEASDDAVESTAPVESDPTIVHAGLTEIDTTGATAPMTNGHGESSPQSAFPTNADVTDNAANAAGENEWDTNNTMSASITQEDWVQVPRDPTETETGVTATPAAPSNVQSWADEQPDSVPQASTPAEANDGFHQVHRNRPRGHEREGSFRGRGRGDYRGGHRGGFHEGRGGRGRGRGRGGMGMRGGRPRAEES